MIHVFEKFAPRWRNAVTRFARAIWYGEDDKEAEILYDNQALRFSKAYRHAMEKYYAEKGMNVYRGTLDGYVMNWLRKQDAMKETLRVTAADKQNKLVADEMKRLAKEKDPQAMLDRLYEAKENETVYKVFSFKDNFKDLAAQHGDENAFELGTGINERIVQKYSDRYFWRTQKDKRVRNTHQQLEAKCFLFTDPPTTIDKYGHRHTGNAGSDFGCVPSGTRIRLNSDIVRCFRRKFTGELSVISTESGITLRATGNHPILTQSGWKPANLVNVDDYVVKVTDKSLKIFESDIYDIGVPIEEIFDFFSLCGDKISVPGGTSQFHGDGIPKEKVDIVTVNWELTNKRNPNTGEFIRKLIFSDTDMVSGELFRTSESEFNALLYRLGLSSLSGVCGGRDLFSLFGRGILKSDDIGLTSVSGGDTPFDDKALDKISGGRLIKVFPGASDSTHSGGITFDDLIFERVTAIDRVISDCHVYNLQTSTSWYIANGLSIHNCRCWAEPAPEREKVLRHYVVHDKTSNTKRKKRLTK
jgi:hypothetical protein